MNGMYNVDHHTLVHSTIMYVCNILYSQIFLLDKISPSSQWHYKVFVSKGRHKLYRLYFNSTIMIRFMLINLLISHWILLPWCNMMSLFVSLPPSPSSLQSKTWRERSRSISKSWRGCDKPQSWTRNDSSMRLSSRKKLLGWVEITKLTCLQI